MHATALARLVEIAEGESPWGLPVFGLAEFLRVVTHPRVFDPPTPLPVGLDFLERLLTSPTIRVLVPGERYWRRFRAASEASDARGNLLFDVQIAAVCLEHGATRLVTADRDFGRFPEIKPDYL